MPYLAPEQLAAVGFKRLGEGVKLSDKASIYDAERIEIGDHSRIDDYCVLSGAISIGRFVQITTACILAGGETGITIDDFSGLAYSVLIFSQSEDYTGRFLCNSTVAPKYRGGNKAPVRLGKHVIVGARSVVCPGVTIAEGCAVGMVSLVRKGTKPWGIYYGNPARRIKERKKDLLELEKQFLVECQRPPHSDAAL